MEPIKFIENKELCLEGCLIKYEGGNDWAKWEEMEQSKMIIRDMPIII